MKYFSDDIIDTKDAGYSSSESEEETAAEKKLRLAKQYLAHIEQEGIAFAQLVFVKMIKCKTLLSVIEIFHLNLIEFDPVREKINNLGSDQVRHKSACTVTEED